MITVNFNLEQPLILKDVNEKVDVKLQEISKFYSKMFKYGLAVLFIGIVTIYIFGMDFTRANDPYRLKFISFTLWNFVISFLLMVPLILKSRCLELISSPYKEASLDKLHDCKAFILMPGMEKHKQYVEDVKKQGRELTYFECDEIIKYWKNLAYK